MDPKRPMDNAGPDGAIFWISLAVVILQSQNLWAVYSFTGQAAISQKLNDACYQELMSTMKRLEAPWSALKGLEGPWRSVKLTYISWSHPSIQFGASKTRLIM